MNDGTELQRFRPFAVDCILPTIRSRYELRMSQDEGFAAQVTAHGGLDRIIVDEAERIFDTANKMLFGPTSISAPFICSFCAHKKAYESKNGLLSQWRAYGTNEGIAIVFDTLKIEALMRAEREKYAHAVNHLGVVMYDNDGAGIKDAFRDFFIVFPQFVESILNDNIPEDDKLFGALVKAVTLVKHHAFYEENEVRIVVSPRAHDASSLLFEPLHAAKPRKVIKYRKTYTGEGRYISLFDDGAALPIRRIIVGPSRAQNFNFQRVADLVAGSDINVDKSDSPLLY